MQKNARVTISELSSEISLSMPATSERVKKLEASGVIKQYTAILDPDLLGKHLMALIFLRFDNPKNGDHFASLVKDEFDMPRDFVHARNANGRVAMGLHGYRIGVGEYGRQARPLPVQMAAMTMPMGRWPHFGWHGAPPRHMDPGGFFRPFLGWSLRQQEGFHLRRIGGELYYPGAPMVYDRPAGRKPGELQSDGYGFYWKGQRPQQQQIPQQDVLAQLQTVIQPVPVVQRPQEPAKSYKELITSDVYFSNEKWQEVLSSHGIVIDADNKLMTIQSASLNADMQYDLKPEELAVLTSNSIKDHTVAERIALINDIIKVDFDSKVTMDALNSKSLIDLTPKPELLQEVNQYQQVEQNQPQGLEEGIQIVREDQGQYQGQYQGHQLGLPEDNRQGVVNMHGSDLDYINPDKGWFREGKHGREVTADDIRVEPTEVEGKYKMTAIIDGEVISHEIKQKDYDKFLAVDDYHRMKLFSKIFNEVDMKDRYPVGFGTKLTAGLLAGLVVTGEVMHGLRGGAPPEIYMGGHPGPCPRPYFKPGVDTPMDVAARNFEAHANTDQMRHDLGFGPGR